MCIFGCTLIKTTKL